MSLVPDEAATSTPELRAVAEFRVSPAPNLPGVPSVEGSLPGPDQLVSRPRALTIDLLGGRVPTTIRLVTG